MGSTEFVHLTLRAAVELGLQDSGRTPAMQLACTNEEVPLGSNVITAGDVATMLPTIPVPTCPKCAVIWDQALEKR